MSYRPIVLPQKISLRPEVLQKLYDMVTQGRDLLGKLATESPSLQNYTARHQTVKPLASRLWAKCHGTQIKSVAFGMGRDSRGATLQGDLTEWKTPADISDLESVLPSIAKLLSYLLHKDEALPLARANFVRGLRFRATVRQKCLCCCSRGKG